MVDPLAQPQQEPFPSEVEGEEVEVEGEVEGGAPPRKGRAGAGTIPSKFGPRPGRATPTAKEAAVAAEARRAKLKVYLETGVTNQVELANLLGVHRNTVAADLKMLRAADADRLRQTDSHELLGETDRVLAEIEGKAMLVAGTSKDTKVQADMLKLARDTRLERIEILFKTGAIPRVDTAEDFLTARKYRSMSKEQLKEEARRIMVKMQYDLASEDQDETLRGRPPSDVARYRQRAEALAAGLPLDDFPPPPPKEESAEDARKLLHPRSGGDFHAPYISPQGDGTEDDEDDEGEDEETSGEVG